MTAGESKHVMVRKAEESFGFHENNLKVECRSLQPQLLPPEGRKNLVLNQL
jgi:hypothetical protein